MNKPKRYFLISHYCPNRGTSKEHPAYYVGAYNYFPNQDEPIDIARCYTSSTMLIRECVKLNRGHWFACPMEYIPATKQIIDYKEN